MEILTFDETQLNEVEFEELALNLQKNLSELSQNLLSVMIVSYINLLFPFNVFNDYVLISKTHRTSPGYGVDFLNELTLFCLTIAALVVIYNFK